MTLSPKQYEGHFYNDVDPGALAALSLLSDEGIIPAGVVEPRSIKDLTADDIGNATQAHFFAGAGAWAYAARLAGWPDHWPLWTGSCPCQPFSQAGKGLGADDPRHLWPDLYRLICAKRPPVVLGEQVAGKAGVDWFNGVRSDLLAADYRAWMVVSPAASVNAPHIRERIYWCAIRGDLADANSGGRAGRQETSERSEVRGIALERVDGVTLADAGSFRCEEAQRGSCDSYEAHRQGPTNSTECLRLIDCASSELVNAAGERRGEGRAEHELWSGRATAAGADAPGDMANTDFKQQGRRGYALTRANSHDGGEGPNDQGPGSDGDGAANFWADHEWITCHDGKARRAPPRPGSNFCDVAYGLPARLRVCDHQSMRQSFEEIEKYGKTSETRPIEILRALRDGILSSIKDEAANRVDETNKRLGGPERFSPSKILFAVLCELDRRYYKSGGVLSVNKKEGKNVRGMWRFGESSLPSYRWEHIQQLSSKPPNSLCELSQLLALHADQIGEAVGYSDAKGLGLLVDGLPGRVHAWRIAGNSIVVPQAVEVIKALKEVMIEDYGWGRTSPPQIRGNEGR